MSENEEVDLLNKARMAATLLSTKAKVSTAKGLVTRSIKKLETSCGEFSLLRPDIPEITKHRLASEIQENRKKVEKNLTQMEETGEVLMSLIAELDQKDAQEDPETMIGKVNDDIELYTERYKNVKRDNVETLESVDSLLKPTKKTTTSPDGSANVEYGGFRVVADLKPAFLDKEASMVEINQWIDQFQNYVRMGYRNNPPAKGVSMHLGNLLHSSWQQSLETKDIKNKTLEEITCLIQDEGKLRMPCHQRRLQLLKAKRNSNKHSDFLYQLESLMSVAEFKEMSADEFIIHLFAETADSTMAKLALEILSTTEPLVSTLRIKVQETENSIWYKSNIGMGKVVIAGERWCEPCKSRTHNVKDCWGECSFCQRRGHRSDMCRNKPAETTEVDRANTAQKRVKKKKKKNQGKTAIEKPEEAPVTGETEKEETAEESGSEEDSPVKLNNRAARVGLQDGMVRKALFRSSLNEELSSMSVEKSKTWATQVFKALKAKSAQKSGNDDSPVLRAKIHSKLHGGLSTNADAIMDSGCTYPLTTLTVTQAIKMKVQPLSRELIIVEASGKNLEILGTVKFYLEAEVLGCRKMVEAAVIRGEGTKEVLVSLSLMKSWDIIHQTFPEETVSDYFCKLTNKSSLAYSSLYSFQDTIYSESKVLKDPSKECRELKEEIIGTWGDCFKEKLGPSDRMKVKPVKLKMKSSGGRPSFCSKPYDTPYHLRDMYEKELQSCLDAGQIVPCGTEPSEWSSKAFPVPKGDGKSVRIVTDFKKLNQQIERCHWPTESSGQLLRHIDPGARYFVSCDLTSGYHQIPLDEESSNLLCISTPMGRYRFTVLAQGVCSSSDIFNFLTDGSMRRDSSGALKNMDDILLFGRDLKELKDKLENFLSFAREKNLKLKPSKLQISEHVEFGGTVISAELVKNEQVVCVLPKDKRIQAFYDMKKPQTKKDIQSFCGMLASLQKWNPSIPLHIPMLRRASGSRSKITWTPDLEAEYQWVLQIMKSQIKLSPYDPSKKLKLVIDGASSIGTGFILCQLLNEEKPEVGCKIINAGSCLLPEGKDFSPVEAEGIALDRAISANHHWIYYCNEVELISDCEGLLGMFSKSLADIENKKLQKILERASNYNWSLTHIKGSKNKICDALSRLCKQVCLYTHKYDIASPRLLPISKRATVRAKQLEQEDPLVLNIAEEGNLDVEYLAMMNSLENKRETKDLPVDSELRQLSGCRNEMSLVELSNGTRLIVKNETEILIPKSLRSEMLRILHLTHSCDTAMLLQSKSRIFWPGMKRDLKQEYDNCAECQENKVSKASEHNEISMDNIFKNFIPGQQVEIDYAQRNNQDYLMIICSLTGFMQAYKTSNKGTSEAVKGIRQWGSQYGLPYIAKSDGGPSFRETWEDELKKLGVYVKHSSAYNPQSMGLVERSVRTLKEILKKNKNLSQLQLAEIVFAINSRNQGEQGSAITRFLGRGVRGNLPNSLDRNVQWKEQVEKRGEIRQKRVDKKGRSVGKKEVFEIGELVKLQNLKTKQWDIDGKILNVRVSADDTIVSYDIESSGNVTTRHRKYIMKLPTHVENADSLEATMSAGSTATAQVSQSMRALVNSHGSVTDRVHYSPGKHHGLGTTHRAEYL